MSALLLHLFRPAVCGRSASASCCLRAVCAPPRAKNRDRGWKLEWLVGSLDVKRNRHTLPRRPRPFALRGACASPVRPSSQRDLHAAGRKAAPFPAPASPTARPASPSRRKDNPRSPTGACPAEKQLGCRAPPRSRHGARVGQLRPVLVLPDDDRDRGRRDDPSLGDDHGEVLHRSDVVHQVEQLEPRRVAPAGQDARLGCGSRPAADGRRLGHQLLRVAQLVVADGVEQHALSELKSLAADQHWHAVLVGCHGHQCRPCPRDQRPVDQHGRRAQQHLVDGRDQIGNRVEQSVRGGDAGCGQPRHERPSFEARPAVHHHHREVDAARLGVQQGLLHHVRTGVHQHTLARRDFGCGGGRDGAVGQHDALVDVGVDLLAEEPLGRLVWQVTRHLRHPQLQPLDAVAHCEALWPAVVQVLDLNLDPGLELAGEHLGGRALEIGDGGL
eukprot:scaffold32350_cov112-Isochrysis_galbana.AAC.2